MSEEKTEDPTTRRMEKARKDGQTLNVVTGNRIVSFFFALLSLTVVVPDAMRYVSESFDMLGRDPAALMASTPVLITDLALAFLRVVAVLLVVSVVSATLFSALVKGGIAVSFVPVQVKVSTLNPAQNLTNMFKMNEIKSVVSDLLKVLVWFAVLAGVLAWLLPHLLASLRFDYTRLHGLLVFLTLLTLALLLGAGVLYATIDYMMERKAFIDTLKMTKTEVKRERQDQHGDPKIKSWRAEMMQNLMLDLPRGAEHATVVVEGAGQTVSVRFDQRQLEVPFVVHATGEAGKGGKARRKAQRAGAVLIEDPKLARRLSGLGLGGLLVEEVDYRPVVMAMFSAPR